MKNSMGTYNGLFSKEFFKQKLIITKNFLKNNFPFFIEKILWYMKKIENYFSYHGILTISIIGLIAYFISSDIISVIFITFLSILFCLINKYIELQKDKFYLNMDFSNAMAQLDSIIAECMAEYIFLNNYDKENFYITEKEQDKLMTEISNMVSSKISNILIKKLSLYYNSDSIYTIIAMRINITIMNYVINNNRENDSSIINPGSNEINKSSTIPFIINNNQK